MKQITLAFTDLILLYVARYVARSKSVANHRGEFTRAPSGVAHRHVWSRYVERGFCGSGTVQPRESSIASARACYYRNRDCIKSHTDRHGVKLLRNILICTPM